jgi:hypothetical protein
LPYRDMRPGCVGGQAVVLGGAMQAVRRGPHDGLGGEFAG